MKRPIGSLFASGVLMLASAGLGCGGAHAEVESPPPRAPASVASTEPAASATATPASAASTATPEADSAPEPETPPEVDSDVPAADTPETGGRNIKYLVSPDGLRVKVDGVVFTPTAEVKRMGKGWGVEVRVEARAEDEAPHSLLAPKGGEVAIAGQVMRSGQTEAESLSDRRTDDRELQVTPKKAVKLARTWPAKDGPAPLAPGDSARLEVGIWGLGADAASRRPVKGLCRIEVKFDKDKPRAKVTAPEGVSK